MSEPFPLQCPVCREGLSPHESNGGLRCPSGHHFDRAREGYVNLLMSNQRKSNQAGDSAEMVQARRSFFAADHYAPLAEALAARSSKAQTILDAGCGTGHLLTNVATAHPTSTCCGIDISKPAIRAAAKDAPDIQWVVANLMRGLPVPDASADLLLNIMSPRKAEEFARVLKPNGRLLIVVPGHHHLAQLRERLLLQPPEEIDKALRATSACASHFSSEEQVSVSFTMHLDQPAIHQLIGMTPLNWKSNRDALEAVHALDRLEVLADFTLVQLSRIAD